MPGSVSDSYDPELGTSEAKYRIEEALGEVYDRVSRILGEQPPIFVLHLLDKKEEMGKEYIACMTEYEWRLIRFALERVSESL